MNCRKLFIFLFAALLFSAVSYGQKWDLKVDKDGIKVSTRTFEGSNVLEFRGEVTIKSNLSGILKLIDSVSAYPKWMHNCEYSQLIKRVGSSSGYTYYVVDAPWPVSDRDAYTFYKATQDTATKVITVSITGMKDYLPEKEGRIRIPKLIGSWQLTPVAKGVTKVVFQQHCDIGGYVPAVLVNAYITETPFINLQHMRSIVESPLYPKTVMKNVKEL